MKEYTWKDVTGENYAITDYEFEEQDKDIYDLYEELQKKLKPEDLYFSVDSVNFDGLKVYFTPKEYTDVSNHWFDQELNIKHLLPKYMQDQYSESLFSCDTDKSKEEIIKDLKEMGFIHNQIKDQDDEDEC